MASSTERAAPDTRGVTPERRRRDGGVRAGAAPVRLRRAPWRVVVARVVVNALAVALVVLVLPGVQVTVRHPVLGYLAIGAVFGLINAFVKPAIQFVALPLLLGSMCLIVLLVDIVVFWVLVRVSPILHTSGTLWIVLAGVLLGLLSYLLDNLLGLVPPILSDHPQEEGHR